MVNLEISPASGPVKSGSTDIFVHVKPGRAASYRIIFKEISIADDVGASISRSVILLFFRTTKHIL